MRWNVVTVQVVRDSKMHGSTASRALAILYSCIYDAWAAYDERAVGTQLSGALRRPASERTEANKERAISYAAYRALTDLVPSDSESVFKPRMRQLGYDPNDNSTDIETPTGIGNVACAAVLEARHHDGSNERGDIAPGGDETKLRLQAYFAQRPDTGLKTSATAGTSRNPATAALGPYSDWTGYTPINPPATVPLRFPFVKPINPDHWQPLTYTDSTGGLVVQMFSGAQWPFVTPFALISGDEFRSALEPGPAKFGSSEYQQQAESLLTLSANLSDRQKMLAEYWSDAPDTEQPIVRWMRFAEFISARDHHSLDDDVKMFFALSNTMLDASIAAWDAKRTFDSVRPVTAIALLNQGKPVRAWGGPGKGTVEMDGAKWCPYQLATYPTPPTPEYVSESSAFSAAAANILARWTGSDRFDYSVTLPAGSSKIEPGHTPAASVTFTWETFVQAAADAGMSGRYGGIQFERADLAGRRLGRLVADRVWAKAQSYFNGTNAPSFPRSAPSRN